LLKLFISSDHYFENKKNLEIVAKKAKKEKRVVFLTSKYSKFEVKKFFLESIGPRFFSNIKVFDFEELSRFVLENFSERYNEKKAINSSLKMVLMYFSVRKLKNQLSFFSSLVKSPKLIEILLNFYEKLKNNNISVEDFFMKTRGLNNKTFLVKTEEIFLILNQFEVLLDKYESSADLLNKLKEELKEGVFGEFVFAVDNLVFFKKSEISVLEKLIKLSSESYITLQERSFKNKTMQNMLNSLKTIPMEILYENFHEDENKAKKEKLEEKNIKIYRVEDIHDECFFVCRKIRDLIIEENYDCDDILVVSRSLKYYKDLFDKMFSKFDIPFYIEENKRLNNFDLLKFIFILFEVISSNFNFESMREYIKFDFKEISDLEKLKFENYIFSWRISGEEWFSDFKKSIFGFSNNNGFKKEFEKKELEKINFTRKKIINSLLFLKKNLNFAKNAKEMCKIFYKFLVNANPFKKIKTRDEYEIFKHVISSFDQIVDLIGEEKISLEDYIFTFKTLLKKVSRKNCQNYGQVRITEPEKLGFRSYKVLFVAGAIDSEFPKKCDDFSIFLKDEQKELSKIGLDIFETLQETYDKEDYLVKKTLNICSQKLFISFYKKDIFFKKKIESSIVFDILSRFSKLRILDLTRKRIDEQIFINSEKITNLNSFSNEISKENSLTAGFLEKNLKIPINFSATGIEEYYSCAFKYFCHRILKLSQRRRYDFDAVERGAFIHFLMENVFKEFSLKDLFDMNLIDRLKVLKFLSAKYISLKFAKEKFYSERVKFLFSKIEKLAHILLEHVIRELKQSEFKPKGFEIDLSKKDNKFGLKPIEVRNKSGKILALVIGKIDRIDVVTKDNKDYFRIIDYKLSKKDFSISDIELGLNMQALIYLLAITENVKNAVPAGAFYLGCSVKFISKSRNMSKKIIESKMQKNFKLIGAILGKTSVIIAMDSGGDGTFVQTKIKNGKPHGGTLIGSEREMKKILEYVKNKVLQASEDLLLKEIRPNPVSKKKEITCNFCEYSPICKYKR
jgi:ATP-dependent helicase/nuclease subunit B